eukprot:m.219130 g.219130  ORF g.219130 m.219130 type:complete len:66 (+) comp39920_c0_seq4:479-676(+)
MIYGPNSVYLHSNILPILGAVVEPPILAVVSQYISHGSLFSILHSGSSGKMCHFPITTVKLFLSL